MLNILKLTVAVAVSAASAVTSQGAAPEATGPQAESALPTPLRTENNDFSVTVNGEILEVYRARVTARPFTRKPPKGTKFPWNRLEWTELASFCSFDMEDDVDVRVASSREITDPSIRPLSDGIEYDTADNAFTFSLSRPGQYVIQPCGMTRPLFLFADPPETTVPAPDDPDVIFFGPGEHHQPSIRLTSGQTLYLAAGAVVHGTVIAENARDIAIRGRGILDGSTFNRHLTHWDKIDGNRFMMFLYNCENVTIEGITIRDSFLWTLVPMLCRDLTIDNLKIIGNWRKNTDGIDLLNCENVLIRNSFVRCFDDAITYKGYRDRFGNKTAEEPVRNVTVRNCVIWNDWARAVMVGIAGWTDGFTNLAFEDIDILHFTTKALNLWAGHKGAIRNVTFSDIRIEDRWPVWRRGRGMQGKVESNGGKVLALDIRRYRGLLKKLGDDYPVGSIENVVFRNITIHAPSRLPYTPSYIRGMNEEHIVRNVLFDDVSFTGTPLTQENFSDHVDSNEFVENLLVAPKHREKQK
mgnify:CR=1 FL=1